MWVCHLCLPLLLIKEIMVRSIYSCISMYKNLTYKTCTYTICIFTFNYNECWFLPHRPSVSSCYTSCCYNNHTICNLFHSGVSAMYEKVRYYMMIQLLHTSILNHCIYAQHVWTSTLLLICFSSKMVCLIVKL